MTTVGHALTGMAIAVALAPRLRGVGPWAAILALGALAANLPDAPLPNWGHDRYDISHSVFVNGTLILLAALAVLAWPRGRLAARGRVALLVSLAWLSHLLLDCCYNHGQGLAMFWPLTNARLALPLPWFDVLPSGRWTLDVPTVKVAMKEVLFFGSVLLLAVVCRVIGWRRRQARARPKPSTSDAMISHDG
jgi:membrane-bound metal-dependent hydrolase YbcI (DUF457 family)